MSRSVHNTRHSLREAREAEYRDRAEQRRHIEDHQRELRKKRLIKRDVREARGVRLTPTGAAVRLPIVAAPPQPFVHYPPRARARSPVRTPLGAGPSAVTWRAKALGLLAISLLRRNRHHEAFEIAERGLKEFDGFYWRHLFAAVRIDIQAQRSEPVDSTGITRTHVERMHRLGFGEWATRIGELIGD